MAKEKRKALPRYKSHKEVSALKIRSVRAVTGSDGLVSITPLEEGFEPFTVSRDYAKKHNPQPGGYYVVYKDGYESFSPAFPFEDGYTLVEPGSEPSEKDPDPPPKKKKKE